jgi:hypothetical protein
MFQTALTARRPDVNTWWCSSRKLVILWSSMSLPVAMVVHTTGDRVGFMLAR